MSNTINFLGTSHGDPSLTRFCSSTLYTFGETKFLIDAGEPATALLIRLGVSPSSLDAIFVTHMHMDHANGLSTLYQHILKYPGNKVEMFLSDPAAIAPFMQWNHTMGTLPLKEELLKVSAVDKDFIWQKNDVTVRTVPTDHMAGRMRSFAYFLDTPAGRILHTGDLAGNFHDFPLSPGDEPVDVCVCESTHIRFHLDAFIEKLSVAPIKKLILNHVGPLWTDGKEQILLDQVSTLPYPVSVAADGLCVTL